MITDLRGRVAAGKGGLGLPLVATYQAKGGNTRHIIQLLQGIETKLSRTNFAGLSDAAASRIVGQAITAHARENLKDIANCGVTTYQVETSACRSLYQFGGGDLHQTLTQAGYKIPGYNAPANPKNQPLSR